MMAIARKKRKKRTKRPKLIQRGDRTHHHDQVMCPVNFKPMNNTVSRPANPIPLDEDEDEVDFDICQLTSDARVLTMFATRGLVRAERTRAVIIAIAASSSLTLLVVALMKPETATFAAGCAVLSARPVA